MNEDIDYEEVLLYHLDIINSYGFDTNIDQIYFEGFWSQGDGASFDFNNVDIEIFLQKLKLKTEYRKLRLKDIDLRYYSYKNFFGRNYCHEKTRTTVYDYNSYNISSNIVSLIDQLQMKIEEKRLELCYSLYNDLKNYYEEWMENYEELEAELKGVI